VTNQLSTPLRQLIERWSDDLRRSSSLLTLTKSGKLPVHAVAFYLASLRYLFRRSEANLPIAAEVARQRGDRELAAYFVAKAQEEQGHDAWASRDLARLPPRAADGAQPARAARALVELQGQLIARHPLCFAAYVLWSEYFTVLLGDEWLDALSASGYARTQVTAIAWHVDADRSHAAHGFSELERLWQGDPPLDTILAGVERAGRIFAAFCDEVFGEAQAVA